MLKNKKDVILVNWLKEKGTICGTRTCIDFIEIDGYDIFLKSEFLTMYSHT